MQRERRLVKGGDYAHVHSQGKSWSHPLLVVRAMPAEGEVTRFGFSVGKRIGKAVVRNRVKRRLKEVVRPLGVKPGWDIVLIARAPASEASYGQLRTTVVEVLKRARLLVEGFPQEGQ